MTKGHFAGLVVCIIGQTAWLGPAGLLNESSLVWFICITDLNTAPVLFWQEEREDNTL